MISEAERHVFMREVFGMTQAEITEFDDESVREWLAEGLPREAAAAGMEPLAYCQLLRQIVDSAS